MRTVKFVKSYAYEIILAYHTKILVENRLGFVIVFRGFVRDSVYVTYNKLVIVTERSYKSTGRFKNIEKYEIS